MWGTAKPTQAAMAVGFSNANMSLVEPAARRKRSRVQCTDYLLWTCCKEPGKEEFLQVQSNVTRIPPRFGGAFRYSDDGAVSNSNH